jgi:hypothetical protein
LGCLTDSLSAKFNINPLILLSVFYSTPFYTPVS